MEISSRFLPAVHLAFHYVRSKQTKKNYFTWSYINLYFLNRGMIVNIQIITNTSIFIVTFVLAIFSDNVRTPKTEKKKKSVNVQHQCKCRAGFCLCLSLTLRSRTHCLLYLSSSFFFFPCISARLPFETQQQNIWTQ